MHLKSKFPRYVNLETWYSVDTKKKPKYLDYSLHGCRCVQWYQHSGEPCCLHLQDKMTAHSTGTLMPTYQTTRCHIPILILPTEIRLSRCICVRFNLQHCAHSQFVLAKPVVQSGVTFNTNSIRHLVCEWAVGPGISCSSTQWLNTSGDDVVHAGLAETDFVRNAWYVTSLGCRLHS